MKKEKIKNIHINNGSNIKGDIISDWNSISYADKDIQKPSEEMLNTNLDFNNYNKDFNNNIIGSDVNNTLKMNVTGNLGLNNSKVDVYSLNNEGTIDIKNNTYIETQNNQASITGNGIINVADNSILSFGSNVQNIQNKLILNNSAMNLKNDAITTTKIDNLTLNNNAYINMDSSLSNEKMDTLDVNTFVNNDNYIIFVNKCDNIGDVPLHNGN